MGDFDVEHFLKEVCGKVERLKGYIRARKDRAYHVEGSFEQLTFEVVNNYEGDTEVITLGGTLTPRSLRALIYAAQTLHNA